MNQIHYRLNEQEAAIIEKKASEAGLKPNTYAKKIALEGKVKAPLLDQEAAKILLPQISKIGANVNQIARSLNMGADVPLEAVEDIKTQLQEVMEAIWAAILDGKKPKKEKIEEAAPVNQEQTEQENNDIQCSETEHKEEQETPKCPVCGETVNKKFSQNRNLNYWICPRYERGNGHFFQWIE